jgi:predicted dithiol-disulfide oxidoreductase (DUF899 family)
MESGRRNLAPCAPPGSTARTAWRTTWLNSTFKYDLGSEDREGHQDSAVSVFTRDTDGTLRNFYTAHPWMAPDIKERGIDLLAPIWHFMDLTPEGRGNWYTSLDYGTKVQAVST